MNTILVTDQIKQWEFAKDTIPVVSSQEYLTGSTYVNQKNLRIFNLCKNYDYQSIGYYVSLLAEARQHKVVPYNLSIHDMGNLNVNSLAIEKIQKDIDSTLKPLKSTTFEISIYFGKNIAHRYDKLAKKLYAIFPVPIFKVLLKKNHEHWKIYKVVVLNITKVPESHLGFFKEAAIEYFSKKRISHSRKKPFKFSLAILHNPEESTAPSNPAALDLFIKSGEKLGIHCELIEKQDYKFLPEYDGLFIRETTSVNHHTYKFARKAYNEGLIVIDDPESILKCTNKVYLTELLTNHKIQQPKTQIISKYNWQDFIDTVTYPCVIKQPDSAFSQGVIKVENPTEYRNTILKLFQTSEMVICQQYMPTEFDWRIGILNNKPIYACKYYMANNHWQIVNWSENKDEGEFSTLSIDEVPPDVLKVALKATKYIGSGLYGVDLKQKDNSIYVIEVNDNPNIDHGVEDLYLGHKLYDQIMQYFLDEMTNVQQ